MKKNIYFNLLIIGSLIVVVFLFLSSSLFQIAEIEITGNSELDENYIKDILKLNDNVNYFTYSNRKAKKTLKKASHYVEDVSIKRKFPDKMTVIVTERKLSGYVEYLGEFLYIDENGRVLEVATSFTKKLPVVIGLNFSVFTVGEILKVKNPISFDVVVLLAHLFNKYKMGEDVIRVDVSKEDDIHLFINKVDVQFGNMYDADEKIRTIKGIMEELKEKNGFLNIKDISQNPVFSYLT